MTWETIRTFGQVRYFNLSYVVLLGVPLLAEFYEVVYYRAQFGGELSWRFPFTFKLLYGASLSYALAVAFYQYFCPAIVKRYASEEDYLTAVRDSYERAYPDRRTEVVLAHLTDTQQAVRDEILALAAAVKNGATQDQARQLDALVADHYPSCVQRFLLAQYAEAARSYPIAMWLAGGLYVAGSLCLLYLLAVRTAKVFTA